MYIGFLFWSLVILGSLDYECHTWSMVSFLSNNIQADSSLIPQFFGHKRNSGIGKEYPMIESSSVLEQSTQRRLWYLYLWRFSKLSE